MQTLINLFVNFLDSPIAQLYIVLGGLYLIVCHLGH